MTTGAGADKVLISDASGVASWGTSTDTDTWITTQTCSTDYALQSVGKTTKTCINKVDYSDVAYEISCTDCVGTTEITDSYVLNTTDSMSGSLSVGTTLTVGGDLTVTGASTNFRNAIKAVDGSGSLIDADMVDGQHASAFGGTFSCTLTDLVSCTVPSGSYCAVISADCPAGSTQTGSYGYTGIYNCFLNAITPNMAECYCPAGYTTPCYHRRICCTVN